LAGIGSKVPVRVVREGRPFEVTLELQALPEEPNRDESP